ncbi:MAG: hypothetical protein M3O33_08740 [Cyanobacteriota bacterium]|nr:hypothetical protein [Cyanobacteriota bacterium]
MEILAIVILGVSALASFSTSARKPKAKINQNPDSDVDLPFIEAYDLNSSNGKK